MDISSGTITASGVKEEHSSFVSSSVIGISIGAGLVGSTVDLERKLAGSNVFKPIASYTSAIETNVNAPHGSKHRFNCTVYGSGSAEAVISG